MSDQLVNDQMHRVFAAFDAGEVPTLAGYMTDDVQLRLGNAETIHGRSELVEAVKAFHASIAGVRHQIIHVFTDGDVVTVEFDVHYTRHDGRVVTLPCCNVIRLRDDLIAEYRSYVDATPVYAEAEDGEYGAV
jgi:ketosteroid isomerase-like protein